MIENVYSLLSPFAAKASSFMRTNNFLNERRISMTVSTIAAGLLLAVIYAGLEVIEVINEKEKKEFENS